MLFSPLFLPFNPHHVPHPLAFIQILLSLVGFLCSGSAEWERVEEEGCFFEKFGS